MGFHLLGLYLVLPISQFMVNLGVTTWGYIVWYVKVNLDVIAFEGILVIILG